MLPLSDGSRITISAVFTVNEGHFPLKLDTITTASTQFQKQYGTIETSSLPIFYPLGAVAPDPVLQDPRVEHSVSVGAPGAVPTLPITSMPLRRSLREGDPTATRLQNIVNDADNAARRGLAGAEAGVFSMSFSPFGLKSLEEEEEGEVDHTDSLSRTGAG